jgi:hypothetical protein
MTPITIPRFGADEYFTAEQQTRLAELMSRWRQARDAGTSLPVAEQAELDSLVAAELQAATARGADYAACRPAGIRPRFRESPSTPPPHPP